MKTQKQTYEEGATWDYDLYGQLRQSRKRAWILALGASLMALLSVLALVLVLPLKEFAPYVITHHAETGYIEVTRGFQPGDLSENEAITMSNLVRYLTARETYDPTDLRKQFEYVTLHSQGKALDEYNERFARDNPKSPTKEYGHHTTVSVQIKNVNFLNSQTATIRFQTEKRIQGRDPLVEHWVSILGFRYVQSPASLKDRFINPLGFQVTSYRKDQEFIPQ